MKDLYKSLTITIVLYKEDFDLLSKCLNNLKNFKVILIDNDDNIDLKKKVQAKYKIHKYILNNKNLGFSKAINQGIRGSDTEYILNLEADCIIEEDTIYKLYEAINNYKDCFITTPTMFNENLELTQSGGALMEKNLRYEVLKLEGDVCVDFPMTAAILFRKQDMINIGLFDEKLFIYFPDCEIGRRIKKFKKSVIQIFDTKAIHTMGNLKIKNSLKKVFYRNYYFTLDELIYYHKENLHFKLLEKLSKKIPNLVAKSIFNCLLFRFDKSIEYLSRVLAYYSFKKNYLKK